MMQQPTGHYLAEFNFGELKHPWDDPRVADFANNLDMVNGVAARADGFVWRLSDADMEAQQLDPNGAFGGNERIASTLSVWRDAQSLLTFVFNTVHKQFYARRREWYESKNNGNLVLWWIPAGTYPSVADGMERFEYWLSHGDTDHAFGWKHLPEAKSWGYQRCEGAKA